MLITRTPKTKQELLLEIQELRHRLAEAEGTLSAIQRGEVDALVMSRPQGPKIVTLKGADFPYHLLLEAMSEGAATVSSDGVILYSNTRLAQLVKTPLVKVIGSLIYHFVAGADKHKLERLLTQSCCESSREEITLETAEGAFIPCHFSTQPLEVDGLRAISLIVTDLTDVMAATEARVRLASLVESSNDAIIGKSLDGIIMSWNAGAERLYGYTAQEVIGQSISLIIPPDHSDELRKMLERIKQGEHIQQFETVRLSKDGRQIQVSLTISPIRDMAGRVAGASAIGRDITKRKQAEQALEENRRRLQALFDNSLDAILLADDTARYVDANPAACTLLGYSRTEILQLSAWDITPEEYRELGQELWQAFINSGQQRGEYALRRKDGTTVDTDYRAVANIVPGLHLSVIRDVTGYKRAEEEIRRRNRELALLNQVIAASAAALEPEAILETVCRELALTFDVPMTSATLLNEEEAAARIVVDYCSPDSKHCIPENRPSILNHVIPLVDSPSLRYLLTHKTPLIVKDAPNDPRLLEARLRLKQRGTTSFLALPIIIDGHVVGSIALETTEPRHFSLEEVSLAWSVADQVAGALARARLTQTHQRLSTVVEQSAESVIITDTKGVIIYVNPAFERISGYTRAEVVGQSPRMIKSGQHEPEFYGEMWATLNSGEVWRGRFINKRKDGSLNTEDATITPVRNESGATVSYVSVQRDVTHELRLEEQYRQAQKMEAIGRLAGGVAHDFNNILVVITGYSELLLQRYVDAQSPHRNYIEEIRKAGERAAGLTRQLLAFSRQQVLQPELLNLNEVVDNIGKMLQRLIGEDIDLVTRQGAELGRVKADPGQIEQVILNLAVNARDAMPQGGKLTIETANIRLDEGYFRQHLNLSLGQYIMLAVSDTGIGMDSEVRRRIFEPFFTTKEMGKGTGLGLATVYGIIKQSGGDIWVYSEPGHGTTFKIYLPRVDEVASDLKQSAINLSLRGGTETVLLVEDEEAVRTLTRRILEMSGYTVLEAGHGGEALLLCEQYQASIQLLITDVVMPHMSGRELAEHLIKSYPQLKVLYVSGYTDDAIVRHGVLDHHLAFLQKPFNRDALVSKVHEVLNQPAYSS